MANVELSEELKQKLEEAYLNLTDEQRALIHYNEVMKECVQYTVCGGKDGFQG